MKKLNIIIQREYLTRVKKKSFIILTVFMPFLFMALVFIPYWLSTMNESGTKEIAIIDNTGLYAPLFKSSKEYRFEVVERNIADKEALKQQLGKEKYAILEITDDLSKKPKAVTLLSQKQPPSSLQLLIENKLSEKVSEQKIERLAKTDNVDRQTINKIRETLESSSHISLSTMRWRENGEIKPTSTSVATIVGIVFTILIYMFIMIYGNTIMQAVMEEKRTRVVEVMVSSVKPVNLLVGKIIGIGLVGITQLVIWGVLLGILSIVALPLLGTSHIDAASAGMTMNEMNALQSTSILTDLMSVNWLQIIFYFIIFFIGGYIIYGSIFAIIGAAVDNEQDTQQFMTPVTILILFAFYAGFYSVQNPDGPLAFWCSFIPFTSPIVMMVRIPFGIPLWQKILSVVILYASFVGVAFVAAKIYRVGILMYGKKPTLKEMIKWMRYK